MRSRTDPASAAYPISSAGRPGSERSARRIRCWTFSGWRSCSTSSPETTWSSSRAAGSGAVPSAPSRATIRARPSP
ncbi:hypothetical protein ACFQ1I_07735 [Kitasatospora arboriphila]